MQIEPSTSPTERRADEQAEWSTADREAPLAVARGAREEASATMSTDEQETTGLARRTILRGAAVAGVAGVAGTTLAACGGDDDAGSSNAAPAGGIPTSDIPVKGGKVVDGPSSKVVVTQPADGEFKAFNAICTHQGCTVNEVENNVIACPCHGSRFSATDGSVQAGPATRPLPGVNISVSGNTITIS